MNETATTVLPSIEDDIRDHWFEIHVVHDHVKSNMVDGRTMERLTWKRPGTNNYRVDYLRIGSILHVSGDIGFASYAWSYDESTDLKWISKLNIAYFASKCEASEYGRGYTDWCDIKLCERMDALFNDTRLFSSSAQAAKTKAAFYAKFEFLGGLPTSKEEWHKWRHANAEEIFGEDLWEFIPTGEIIAHRCHAHLLGLNMAMKQLAEGTTEE